MRETESTTKEELKVLYTNADQFINKRDDLLMLIADDEPDVILINEVIPKKQTKPIAEAQLQIDGYNCQLNFDPNSADLGTSNVRGVAIYSKKSLNVVEVGFDIEGFYDHSWIEVSSERQKSLLCGCVYRSPSNDTDSNGRLSSTEKIIELIKAAYNHNANLLITGDFNYKDIDWNNNFVPTGQQHLSNFIEALNDCYLFQHVTEPTRYRKNEISNLLDLVITSEEGMIQDLHYLPPLGESDHLCLKFKVLISKSFIKKPPVYNIFKTNYEALKSDLCDYDWMKFLNSNFENDYNNFFSVLKSLLKKYTPLKRPSQAMKSIYLTKEATRLKNAKHRSWKRYKSTQSDHDRRNYVHQKNKLRSLTRNLRRNFERFLSNNMRAKPKNFWRYAKSRLKTNSHIPTLMKHDGSRAIDPKNKAEAFNAFFTSVFTIEDTSSMPTVSPVLEKEVLSTVKITPEIVQNKLQKLNENKSPGHDGWHPFFIKQLADTIHVPLSILFNKSIKEGAHSSWLKAVITPIHKKGNKSLPSNYRPISLTSVLSKIMESIIRDEMLVHLTKQNHLCDEQHGFVPGRNCTTQLLLCLEEWTSMIEDKKDFDIIYTDFSKAFDSVAHQRLLLKLELFGITGEIMNWIKSYPTR